MNSIQLPICNPLIRGYLHNAYQLAILGCKKEAKVWIFSNYIQLVSENGNSSDPVAFYLPDYPGYNWSILTPWFDYSVITRDFIKRYDIVFQDLIRDALSQQQYIFLYINEKYITGTVSEADDVDFNHHILLHGYSADNDEISFLGYDKSRSFTERTIDIHQLERAYFYNRYNYDRYENRMYFLKVREDEGFKLSFELDHIIQQLAYFRDSKKVINNVLDYHIDYQYTYGLDVYDSLIRNLELFHDDKIKGVRPKLIIPLHLVMEHKLMMVERFKFMAELFPNIALDRFIEEYNGLQKNFELFRNLCMKYDMTRKKTILIKMMNDIFKVKEKERVILTSLISYLSEFSNNLQKNPMPGVN